MNKNEFKYVILDQRETLGAEGEKIQAEFFTFWNSYWNDILKSVGLKETIDPSEFYEQDKITAIVHNDSVVAMHILSFVKREQYQTSHYLKKFNNNLKDYFQNSTINSFQTLQYLAFNPSWKTQKEKPVVFMPMVITDLSCRHKKLEGVDAVMSVARKDLGASNSLAKMNFTSFLDEGSYNNTPVAYQITTEPKPYPHPDFEELVSYYWNQRIEIKGTRTKGTEAA